MNLKYLIQNKEKCDELLQELDAVATNVDPYEYGLPIHNEDLKARMREVIYLWASTWMLDV